MPRQVASRRRVNLTLPHDVPDARALEPEF